MTADTQPHPLEFLFHPRSIAIPGVSSKAKSWGSGDSFVRALKRVGFRGPIYPVNPKLTESNGLPCYASLLDIPGDVDYVISSVPAPAVPTILEQAITKGARSVHLFTSGFGETGDAGRAELEQGVLKRARAAGIRLLGPNCMGLYCPETGLAFDEWAPRKPGDIGMLSQSGANAEELMAGIARRGLRFSKIISYGNALDLNECDFLEYLTHDPRTALIACYIEGPRDGRRFFRLMREATRRKPVILLKSGLTEAGGRAARSHTGSLAGSEAAWRAFERQAGFVRVETMEELEDLVVTFRLLPRPTAPGAAIVVAGGGSSVLGADAASRAGLPVPPLSAESQAALGAFTPIAGSSVRNPIDTPVTQTEEELRRTLDIVAKDPGIGLVLYHAWFRPDETGLSFEESARRIRELLTGVRASSGKPIALSLHSPGTAGEFTEVATLTHALAGEEIPVFSSLYRGIAAAGRWMRWYRERGET
jgi:acyl-CoA synthetase (NDP forming)